MRALAQRTLWLLQQPGRLSFQNETALVRAACAAIVPVVEDASAARRDVACAVLAGSRLLRRVHAPAARAVLRALLRALQEPAAQAALQPHAHALKYHAEMLRAFTDAGERAMPVFAAIEPELGAWLPLMSLKQLIALANAYCQAGWGSREVWERLLDAVQRHGEVLDLSQRILLLHALALAQQWWAAGHAQAWLADIRAMWLQAMDADQRLPLQPAMWRRLWLAALAFEALAGVDLGAGAAQAELCTAAAQGGVSGHGSAAAANMFWRLAGPSEDEAQALATAKSMRAARSKMQPDGVSCVLSDVLTEALWMSSRACALDDPAQGTSYLGDSYIYRPWADRRAVLHGMAAAGIGLSAAPYTAGWLGTAFDAVVRVPCLDGVDQQAAVCIHGPERWLLTPGLGPLDAAFDGAQEALQRGIASGQAAPAAAVAMAGALDPAWQRLVHCASHLDAPQQSQDSRHSQAALVHQAVMNESAAVRRDTAVPDDLRSIAAAMPPEWWAGAVLRPQHALHGAIIDAISGWRAVDVPWQGWAARAAYPSLQVRWLQHLLLPALRA